MFFNKIFLPALGAIQLLDQVAAQVHPCREAAIAQDEALSKTTLRRPADIRHQALFDAEIAFKCITSVRLSAKEATETMEMAKQYAAFQSSLTWLKDPPKSYQVPGVDVLARIDEIIEKIADDGYKSHYDFEMDVTSISRETHEGHFVLPTNLVGLFTWQLPDSIVSISSNGRDLPQVYAQSDILSEVENKSPIVEMEGESVFEYLREHIEQVQNFGLVESHAEWNEIMGDDASLWASLVGSPTSRAVTSFEEVTIYNGPSIKGRFANGTEFEWIYRAGSGTNLIEQGLLSDRDIYFRRIVNPDVVSIPSGLSRPGQATEIEDQVPEFTAVPFKSFPQDPIVMEDGFGVGGSLSGYILKDVSVGVLSVPSFAPTDASTFHSAVADFIKKAKAAKVKKVVIDLSGNGGGRLYLGYLTFKQFFPGVQPGLLVRSRATPQTHTYGRFATAVSVFDSPGGADASVVYNAEDSLKPDGTGWGDYNELFGPVNMHNDNFTETSKMKSSSSGLSGPLGFNVPNYDDAKLGYKQPWASEDIILLVNGKCHSTCHIFGNLMKQDGGIKSVVVGGIPQNGPMQAISGTRGSNKLDWDFYSTTTSSILNTTGLDEFGITDAAIKDLPPLLGNAPWFVSGGVNTLDSFIADNQDVPRQFVYEAANCRLFWTEDMFNDVTQLWRAAATFAGGDDSMCVPGSVDGPGSGVNETLSDSPGFSYKQAWERANSTEVFDTVKLPGETGAVPPPTQGVNPGTNNGESPEGGSEDDESIASIHGTSIVGLLGVLVFMVFF
ncbi:Peptidase S41 family protein ustP [Paramyrothecium foliicola]|nr:Peptidase S41 family protein ustP [Paramyrothecium foliicola]